MLLNNFRDMLIAIIPDRNKTLKSFDNTNVGVQTSASIYYVNSTIPGSGTESRVLIGFYGLVFGTGTTPPQLTDYKLENIIQTGYTDINGIASCSTNKLILSQVVTATSNITINEVGIRLCSNTTGASLTSALITRTVLSEPVVLTSGQSKTFTVEIDYNTFVDNVNNL